MYSDFCSEAQRQRDVRRRSPDCSRYAAAQHGADTGRHSEGDSRFLINYFNARCSSTLRHTCDIHVRCTIHVSQPRRLRSLGRVHRRRTTPARDHQQGDRRRVRRAGQVITRMPVAH